MPRLTALAAALRGCDQLTIAAVPLLAATVFAAGPETIGLLVALQGSAWLVASIPAGVAIDRTRPTLGLSAALAACLAGGVIATAGVLSGVLAVFAAGTVLIACGAVIGLLAEAATLQAAVPPQALPQANARLQIVTSTAMLTAPILAGLAVAYGAGAALVAAPIVLALAGFVAVARLPAFGDPPSKPRNVAAEIAEGLAFVRGEPHLVGIVACAVFWNMAFFAFVAIFVPFAMTRLTLDAAAIGFAQAAMGVGSVAAAAVAGMVLTRFAPRLVLVFGPASSFLATTLLIVASPASGVVVPAVVYFALGFGPILWFVCQNTIRQLVTPKGMLGRVGSVIQVAIYGVRSIGALAGGLVAAHLGFDAALLLIVTLFAASTIAVLVSPLARLSAMPAARG